jgi:hypothetical protein
VGPDAPAYPANRQSSMHINGFPPYRRRMIMPFTATATSVIQPELSSGMNWVSGDVYITNVGVFEIEEILHMDAYLPTNVEGIWDFTAMGVDAGKSYHLHVWADAANSHPLVESRVGTGSWTTLAESTLGTLVEPIQITAESLSFTVPADATEVRLRLVNPGTNVWCDLFTAPPEFFDGDTPDAGGYTYSWEGTAYDSRSIRSDVPTGPTAQAWVAGTARNVTEMRVVVDGTLVPVTQAGA